MGDDIAKLSDEEKGELAKWQIAINNDLNTAQRQGQLALEQYRQELVVQFRNEIRPTAHEVAAAKGLGIVIPKSEGFLLSVDPGVDITNEVIHKLQTTTRPAKASVKSPEKTAAAPAAEKTERK
jgi:Skp family chaperone for outer membrane proteins